MKIRVGTRGSKLAITQTGFVCEALKAVGFEIEIIEVKTLGDKKQGTPAAKFGDKKDWIYELELALLAGQIDLAVHSGKDVPANTEKGTALFPVMKRESPYDVFIGRKNPALGRRISFAEAGSGLFGTSSLRRKAQLLNLRPKAAVIDHRGNVPTRIDKLDSSEDLCGIILAESGIIRLGLKDLEFERIPAEMMLPAVNQGTLCAQIRESETRLAAALKKLSDPAAAAAFEAERACVLLLNGDCDSAIGVFAEVVGRDLRIRSRVLLPDGTKQVEVAASGSVDDASGIGIRAAQELIARGAPEILEESKKLKRAQREKADAR